MNVFGAAFYLKNLWNDGINGYKLRKDVDKVVIPLVKDQRTW